MTARIDPAAQPYSEAVQKTLDRVMPPGVPPLALFTTLARSERAFSRFMAAGLIDKGPISLKEREIMIDRTCVRAGSEYEWGVHVALFAERAGLTKAQIAGTTARQVDQEIWTERERLIIRLADELHDNATIGEDLWPAVSAAFSVEQILELILLAGFYRTVAYLTNGLRLPLESFGARFSGERERK